MLHGALLVAVGEAALVLGRRATGCTASEAGATVHFEGGESVRARINFEGTYTRIVPHKAIEYRMSDGREVEVEFVERAGVVVVKETFDAETENPPELQRAGWQATLDNFGRYLDAKG